MEMTKVITVTLNHEDVCRAIAEYASTAYGEYTFNAEKVRIHDAHKKVDKIEISATVAA